MKHINHHRRAWLSAITVFLLLQTIGGSLAAWFRLSGWDLAILLGGLLLLGLVAAMLVFFLVRKRSPATAHAARRDDDIDLVLAAARKRLAARPGGAAKLGKLPVVLVLGPSGSTKTTAVIHSGLDPELLAGEAHRGDAVVSTGAANLWYAEDVVVAEAGGALVEEPERWARLIRQLRPSRWSAALTRKVQAPRMAVVCFPCDAFLQPGSSQSVPAAARTLRARLVELSQQFGIRLPVYVLFTKTDRIPHFEDFVRSFSRDEAQQVLGATLPVPDAAAPGVYAEQESRRLADAFHDIFRSLALRRLDVLPRENREEVKAGAYEFPREFRKITDLATQFMVELCKPSQLSVTPFLRGFYFTGVRPVVVSDTAAEAPVANSGGSHVALGATGVFSLQGMQPPRAPAAGSPGTRRVPEWAFLKRLFREVILPDQVARGITGGGTRVNFLRRAMIGSAAALFLVLALGFTVSYVNNRALADDALAAAHGVEPLSAVEREAPSPDALQRLEALRGQTERVGQYERAGRPWRLAWGLYTGSALYPSLRRLYFDRFDRLLFSETRSQLVSSLQALPDPPQNATEFSAGYDALKAYLITTNHPEHSTPEFLTPELLKHWPPAPGVDEPRLETTRAQFDFYARELRIQDPYRLDASEGMVARVRGSLHNFSGPDRFYQSLLAHAAGSAKPVAFHQAFPGTESVVRNPHVVPAAFTREGWEVVESSLANVDALFQREACVLG
jgi:type VI secretion system protein ImpL